jgi:DNA repair protein RadC
VPSRPDIALARELAQAGKLLNIELLDYIILGQENHTSLREKGLGFS